MNIADTVRDIVSFADLRGTSRLSRANKYFHKIITQDSRFIFLRIIYLLHIHKYNKYINVLINTMCSGRYFYYKLRDLNPIWHSELSAEYAQYSFEFYQQLHADKTVINSAFNPYYSESYYWYKKIREYVQPNKYYELSFNEIIKYFIDPNYTMPVFKKFIETLPATTYLLDTELACNLLFLEYTNNKNTEFRFRYGNVQFHAYAMCDLDFNNKSLVIVIEKPEHMHCTDDLFDFIMRNIPITTTSAKQLIEFLQLYYKINHEN